MEVHRSQSPWWGGWWESLIGVMKSALKRSIGSRSLPHKELETILHEVEACLNSRPLTYVDLESEGVLTPAHFLVGRALWSKPLPTFGASVVSDSKTLIALHLQRLCQLEKFWTLWREEYIRNLPSCRGSQARGAIKEGSLVLVKDESRSRLQWPLGHVQKLHPGRDGIVRCVDVRTPKGVVTRPIQKLHNFEVVGVDRDEADEKVVDFSCAEANAVAVETEEQMPCIDEKGLDVKLPDVRVSRTGRHIKKPVRLDL